MSATLDGRPTILEVGEDPTTGVFGVKFDEGVEDTGCHLWSVTFDASVLAEGFTIVAGCVQVATKSGPVENNGYACALGPVCADPPPTCWQAETAWASGLRYVPRGSWATYTPYFDQASVVTLFAGQSMAAGVVLLSAPSDGMVQISIELAEGFRFAPEVEENVKIQDYSAPPPPTNPVPGGFSHRGTGEGRSFSMVVPRNAFYGIHVDVEREVECEE